MMRMHLLHRGHVGIGEGRDILHRGSALRGRETKASWETAIGRPERHGTILSKSDWISYQNLCTDTYVHYFEVGRLTAMADAGLPFGAILKQGYTVVAVDLYVQYKAPAYTDDVLEVESYITDFHGALMTWQQTISRCADGVLVAVAEVNGAFTRADGRPTRIPPSMRTLLETVYVANATPVLSRQRRRPSV
jgi:YbgC/YbaW family acyl-CoA thioester hydrolase